MDLFQILSDNSRRNPFFAVFLGLLLFILHSVVLLPFFLLLVSLITGVPMDGMRDLLEGNLSNLENGPLIFKLLQAANQLLVFGLAGFVMGKLLGKPSEVLGLSGKPSGFHILLAVPIILVSIPLVQFLTFDAASFEFPTFLEGFENWVEVREKNSQEILLSLLEDTRTHIFLTNILIFALVPAICEEIFFRGFLQQTLAKAINPHMAILLSAFIFSFIHFQFFGMISRMFLGVILGYFLYRSGSLLPGIAAHFAFNFTSIFLSYLVFKNETIDRSLVEDTYSFPIVWVILSAVLVSLLFFEYFRRPAKAGNH